MIEESPATKLKRSEVLAIENIRRISEQLRAERNEAFSLAQAKTVALATAIALLTEARAALPGGDLANRIETFISANSH
jgi:hypothetical protein